MENACYSSDDEIAWGPLTLREIRKELARSPRKIKHRESDSGIYYTPASSILINQEKSAENSEYYTPEQSANKVETFLEQVSKVIGGESTDECLESNCSTTVNTFRRDTLAEILRHNEQQPNLNDCSQTLVENSVLLSPNPDGSVCVESIICSDDSTQEFQDEENCAALFSPELVHDSPIEEISDEGSYTESDVIVISDESFNDSVSGVLVEEPVFLKIEEEESVALGESLSSCNLGEKEKVLQESSTESPSDEFSSLNSDHETEENIQEKLSPSLSIQNDSLEFNDTLEEMEMALKQGLDYVFPEDTTSQNCTPFTPQETNTKTNPSSTKKKLFQPSKFSHIQSPVADYIKKNNDPFKLPLKPIKTKTTQNSRIPKIFTNTVSPVSVYIKNSPCSSSRQNVSAKPTPWLTASESVPHNKENNADLPDTVYKPPRKVITFVKKNINLPSSIQKFVPESTVAEHTKRAKKETNIQAKILDEDLTTVDSSLLSEDTSFLQVKQAFIE